MFEADKLFHRLRRVCSAVREEGPITALTAFASAKVLEHVVPAPTPITTEQYAQNWKECLKLARENQKKQRRAHLTLVVNNQDLEITQHGEGEQPRATGQGRHAYSEIIKVVPSGAEWSVVRNHDPLSVINQRRLHHTPERPELTLIKS